MEAQVLEGTLSEVQRRLGELPVGPDERVRVVVSPAPKSEPPAAGATPFRVTEFRNGVPLLPRRSVDVPVGLDLVKRLLDEEDAEPLDADRTAGY